MPKKPHGTKPLQVNLDPDLHLRIKAGAALVGSSMNEIVATLIDEYMPVVENGVPTWNEKRRKELVKLLNES